MRLNNNRKIGNVTGDTWSYAAAWLMLLWHDGLEERVYIERDRDWENRKVCLIFSGLNEKGVAVLR
jgi:arabinan endo-1,5-alpha-L-arabinosidase